MEVEGLLSHDAIPVVVIVVLAVLVFAFGFKPVTEPSFQLDPVPSEKKAVAKKKGKGKEAKKKTQVNGLAVREAPSEQKAEDKKPVAAVKGGAATQPPKQATKPTEPSSSQKVTKTKASKQKKVAETVTEKEQKPEGFDDGNWVQAVNKRDKKQRRKDDVLTIEEAMALMAPTEKPAAPSTMTRKTLEAPAQEPIKAAAAEQKVETPTQKPAEVATLQKPAEAAAPAQSKSKKSSSKKKTAEQPKQTEPVKEAEKPVVSKINEPLKEDPSKESNNNIAKEETPEVKEAAVKATLKAETTDKTNEPTNIVFDELGDEWQESKPQKKKKKARRD